MFCKLQNDHQELVTEFCPGGKKEEKSKGTKFEVEEPTPNPRVELLYTYLMAWFIMYFPSLMTSPPKDNNGVHSFNDMKDVIGGPLYARNSYDYTQSLELPHLPIFF